jgi:putative DNA primase/helicase
LGKAAFAAGVERLAQSDRAFAVTADLFDRDPWLLGTPGGTVDLRTGELRAASLQDYISKQTRVTPAEPGTPHPLWTQFLKEFTNGDREYRRFIQQVCGYCLTGDVREECLFFFFGPGQTGKGTLLRTVANIAGDYATASGMETFTISKFSCHPTELAKLAGARMVTATETERGRTWAWARIKYLTGNEGRVSAHFMRQDDFEHEVTYKLVFAGNHKPRLPSTDEDARRRVNVLPATHRVEQPDNTLKNNLVMEYPAILRWAIDGCLDWQANGLLRAAAVLVASRAYLEEQDVFTHWVDAECTTGLTDSATHKALFMSWSAFAVANGVHPGSGMDFTEQMIRAGFKAVRHTPGDNARRGFVGIALAGLQTSTPPGWSCRFPDPD